ncbi:MAG: NAD-binding protein [Chloroflexi bacterium]|nr:NAD-binding protein [Chloroflexota bacterium]
MRIIIVGCGRLGSGLAKLLSLQDHAVTVVDSDPLAFERLGPAFKGKTVVGIGFDRDVLIQAGIERADCLAAVMASDDANVVAARLASQVFHVPKVIARLYDPRKAEIYQRLGLQTISPITWGINRIANLLCGSPLETVLTLGSDVDIIEAEIPSLLVGRTVKEVTILGEVHVVAITRSGKTFLPTQGTVFQAGDLVHLAALTTSTERVKALLGLE